MSYNIIYNNSNPNLPANSATIVGHSLILPPISEFNIQIPSFIINVSIII